MEIIEVVQKTKEKWLNLFEAKYKNKNEKEMKWTYASRRNYSSNKPDAVIIVPIYKNKLILTKEYRVPIQNYEYGFPAGLVKPGEDIVKSAIRELKEETGLEVKSVINVSPLLISSAGLSDESVKIVFVKAKGKLSTLDNEDSEEIEILCLSKKEITKLLNKKNIKIGSKAYSIMLAFATTGNLNLFKRK